MKLAGKFILLFIIAAVAVTAVSSYFTSQQYFSSIKDEHRKIVQMVAELENKDSFRQAMQTGDRVYFAEMVKTMTDYSTTVRWVWFEKSANKDERPSVSDAERVMETHETTSLTGRSSAGRRSLFTYYPLKQKKGAIEIASSLEEADELMEQTWLTAVLSIGAMALFSIGVVMIAGIRWIGRPLDALTAKMQRVGQGEFTGPLEIRSRDELGQLADSVNKMCVHLEAQKTTIERETNHRIRTLEQLRHADRLKTVGQLAAGFAHEVGTPLNVVAGRASMILANPTMTPEKIKENAQAIKTESERISSIVQKLLDFSRQSDSKKALGDLRDVVNHAVQLIQPLVKNRNIQLTTSLPDEPGSSNFDFNQMQQVLINLIDNAVDASEDGGVVNVAVKRSDDRRHWQLEIADQGHGIDPATQDLIFEPFFTTKGVGAGTGLGLSIVHGIVEDHGGSIQFTSQPGAGTTFIIQLPAA